MRIRRRQIVEVMPLVMMHARRAVMRREFKGTGVEPEDLVQEVMVQVLEAAHKYDPDRGSIANYVITIAHRRWNALAARGGAAKAQREFYTLTDHEYSSDVLVEYDVDADLQRKEVLMEFVKLKKLLVARERHKELRALLTLLRCDGVEAHACKALGCTLRQFKILMKRVKQYEPARRLKRLIEDLHGTDKGDR